jgi:hypothetical protein
MSKNKGFCCGKKIAKVQVSENETKCADHTEHGLQRSRLYEQCKKAKYQKHEIYQ